MSQDPSADTALRLLAATAPVVAELSASGQRVGHLLLALGAGRFCAEAGPQEAAATLREFAVLVEKGQVADHFAQYLQEPA